MICDFLVTGFCKYIDLPCLREAVRQGCVTHLNSITETGINSAFCF